MQILLIYAKFIGKMWSIFPEAELAENAYFQSLIDSKPSRHRY